MDERPASARQASGLEEDRRSINLGIFGRTPPFTRRQQSVFLITASAGFFESYDTALLGLALKQIQRGLRIAEARLGGMLSVIQMGYIASLLLAPLADVFGRRRLLLYTIVGYTAFTGLTAIAPQGATFMASQFVARAFAGAEATVALVILTEEVDAGVRGWTVGLLSALAATGYGLAAGVFALVDVIPFGWRGLYALAVIPLVLIIPLRRMLPESGRFERQHLGRPSLGRLFDPFAALVRVYPGRLMMLLAVVFFSSMGGSAAGLYFSKFLQEFHGWSPGSVSLMYFLGGGVGILGSIIAGRLSDRIGRRRLGVLFMLLAPLLTVLLYSIPTMAVVPLWIAQLFAMVAGNTMVATYGAELFPTSYRSTAGSSRSAASTLGAAIGLGLESILYGLIGSHWTAVRYLAVFWLVAPLVMLLFPETAGLELEEIAGEKGREHNELPS